MPFTAQVDWRKDDPRCQDSVLLLLLLFTPVHLAGTLGHVAIPEGQWREHGQGGAAGSDAG